jgi:hypothetical protein
MAKPEFKKPSQTQKPTKKVMAKLITNAKNWPLLKSMAAMVFIFYQKNLKIHL